MRGKRNFALSVIATGFLIFFGHGAIAGTTTIPTPEPLLELLVREGASCDKDIYITSIKFLSETKEIVVMYMETPGLLVTGTYNYETSANKMDSFSQRLYIQDVKIPSLKVRGYYTENAPRVNELLERVREFLKKQKNDWGSVK